MALGFAVYASQSLFDTAARAAARGKAHGRLAGSAGHGASLDQHPAIASSPASSAGSPWNACQFRRSLALICATRPALMPNMLAVSRPVSPAASVVATPPIAIGEPREPVAEVDPGNGRLGGRRAAVLDQDFLPGTALVAANERLDDNAAELLGSLDMTSFIFNWPPTTRRPARN